MTIVSRPLLCLHCHYILYCLQDNLRITTKLVIDSYIITNNIRSLNGNLFPITLLFWHSITTLLSKYHQTLAACKSCIPQFIKHLSHSAYSCQTFSWHRNPQWFLTTLTTDFTALTTNFTTNYFTTFTTNFNTDVSPHLPLISSHSPLIFHPTHHLLHHLHHWFLITLTTDFTALTTDFSPQHWFVTTLTTGLYAEVSVDGLVQSGRKRALFEGVVMLVVVRVVRGEGLEVSVVVSCRER